MHTSLPLVPSCFVLWKLANRAPSVDSRHAAAAAAAAPASLPPQPPPILNPETNMADKCHYSCLLGCLALFSSRVAPIGLYISRIAYASQLVFGIKFRHPHVSTLNAIIKCAPQRSSRS